MKNQLLPVFAICFSTLCFDLGRAAMLGDEGPRKTLEEFATANRFSATKLQDWFGQVGYIHCEGSGEGVAGGTGQITLKGDVVTTALHVVVSHTLDTGGKCPSAIALRQCVFQLDLDKNMLLYPVKEMIAHGPLRYPGYAAPRIDECFYTRDDWAVLKLTRPVPGVKPYAIDLETVAGERVLSPFAFSKDFVKENRALQLQEHSAGIADCHITRQTDADGYIETDCYAARGQSGSALLRYNGPHPTMVGILSNGPSASEAGEYTLSARFAPISIELWVSLQKAAGLLQPAVTCKTKATVSFEHYVGWDTLAYPESFDAGTTVEQIGSVALTAGRKTIIEYRPLGQSPLFGLVNSSNLDCGAQRQ